MGETGRSGVDRAESERWRFSHFLLLVSGLSFLIWAQDVKAGTIGDPTASGKPNTLSQLNLEYDSIERKMDSGDSGFGGKTTSERVLLQGIYGLTPFVDLYLRVGVADLETASRNFQGKSGFAFGGGGRWTLFQRGDLNIGLGIQVLEFFSNDSCGEWSVSPPILGFPSRRRRGISTMDRPSGLPTSLVSSSAPSFKSMEIITS